METIIKCEACGEEYDTELTLKPLSDLIPIQGLERYAALSYEKCPKCGDSNRPALNLIRAAQIKKETSSDA